MQDSWRQSIPSPPCGLGKGEYIPFLFHQTWVPAKERLACYSLTGCLLNWANKYLCLDSVAEVGSVLRGIWLESSEVWRLWENRKCAHFWCGDFEIRASARKDSGADLAVVCKGVKKKKKMVIRPLHPFPHPLVDEEKDSWILLVSTCWRPTWLLVKNGMHYPLKLLWLCTTGGVFNWHGCPSERIPGNWTLP